MPTDPIVLLDYAGVCLFAASGAIAAIERREDVVTAIFFGTFTGTGGGTLRDLLIGAPVFWVDQSAYLVICVATSLLIWFLPTRWTGLRLLLWLDAIGTAAYATLGVSKAHAYGHDIPVGIVMGVLTACFGGVIRDTLANQPSVLLRREIYVTAAILAAAVDAMLLAAGMAVFPAAIIGTACGFALRAGSLRFGWTLPRYRPR